MTRTPRIRVATVACPYCADPLYVDVWPPLEEAAQGAKRDSQILFRVNHSRGCGKKVPVRAGDVRLVA